MKKVLRIILAAHLALFILICSAHVVYRRVRFEKLAHCVNIADGRGFRLKDYDYWKDFLDYVSGHEVIALRVEPDKWSTPDGWNREEVGIDDLDTKFDFAVREFEITNLKVDTPQTFDEWYFIENDRATQFDDWEYYIGLYSDRGLLIIYRGHHLNTEIYLLAKDPPYRNMEIGAYDGDVDPWSD